MILKMIFRVIVLKILCKG